MNPQLKRAHWHDYRSPGRYHITLSKAAGVPLFSSIEGDWRLPVGAPGSSFTRWSPLGAIIASEIYHLSETFPAFRADQYIVMPDHVHILLWVKETLPEHLGYYIARFKNLINFKSGIERVFAEGYNDRIITPQRDLNTIFHYLRSNPWRLGVRRANPDFFHRRSGVVIGGMPCQLYGNHHLLDNPFKDQVIVHRADSPETFARHKEEWLYAAANGGVLVSPFVSPREKEIRAEAQAAGARLILITHRPLDEREKPAAADFELCALGRMLILAPASPLDFSRATCQHMNALAAELCASTNP